MSKFYECTLTASYFFYAELPDGEDPSDHPCDLDEYCVMNRGLLDNWPETHLKVFPEPVPAKKIDGCGDEPGITVVRIEDWDRGRPTKPASSKAQIGARMRAKRREKGLTMHNVSSLLKISYNHISSFELGYKGLSIERLAAYARLLGVTLDWAVSGADPEEASDA